MRTFTVQFFGEAKVYQLEVATRSHKDVFRLQVAVHNPAALQLPGGFQQLDSLQEKVLFANKCILLIDKSWEGTARHQFIDDLDEPRVWKNVDDFHHIRVVNFACYLDFRL